MQLISSKEIYRRWKDEIFTQWLTRKIAFANDGSHVFLGKKRRRETGWISGKRDWGREETRERSSSLRPDMSFGTWVTYLFVSTGQPAANQEVSTPRRFSSLCAILGSGSRHRETTADTPLKNRLPSTENTMRLEIDDDKITWTDSNYFIFLECNCLIKEFIFYHLFLILIKVYFSN